MFMATIFRFDVVFTYFGAICKRFHSGYDLQLPLFKNFGTRTTTLAPKMGLDTFY